MNSFLSGSCPPRVLLVEDDGVSRAFLAAATQALPAVVDAADSIASALDLASHHTHALWLIDANLPDGHGTELLARLRERNGTTPALAHTATSERAVLEALIAAGFSEVLVKPIAAAQLHAALRRALGRMRTAEAATAYVAPPLWDDSAALAALNGQHAHVDALRTLFIVELPRSRDAIRVAAEHDDPDAVRAALHRLRASCGFVGAMQLGALAQVLEADPLSATGLQQLVDALDALLASTWDSGPRCQPGQFAEQFP